MSRENIVVLGGGSGGIAAAAELGRKLGRDHNVTLVDRAQQHVYMPALLMLMTGDRAPTDITRDLKRLERFDVSVVQSTIRNIDVQKEEVILDDQRLPFDYLVVSLGLQTHPELIPGFQEAGGQHAWELDAAVRCQQALRDFQGGRVVVGLPPGPYRCPPAPFETLFSIDSLLRKRGLRDATEIHYFAATPRPEGPPEAVPVWLNRHAEERGVRTHYGFEVQSVDPGTREVVSSSGERLPYDLLFIVPPHKPAQVLLDSGLAGPAGVRVDPYTLTTECGNVWAIGDGADFPGSKAGVVAHQQADLVAHNIAVRVTGQGEEDRFKLQTT
ncbi:MAG: FAD/NAD(P)-binding oxidoreductase [Chloroflexota bacterium]